MSNENSVFNLGLKIQRTERIKLSTVSSFIVTVSMVVVSLSDCATAEVSAVRSEWLTSSGKSVT